MDALEKELREALEVGDLETVGLIVDIWRFDYRMNYRACCQAAYAAAQLSPADWDELLYEVDQQYKI